MDIPQADLDLLNEKDKNELRSFISAETQRQRVQGQTHALTDQCWKKCVTSPIKSNQLDKNEVSCMADCVARFLDVNLAIVSHVQKLTGGGKQ
ncbi:mitochondrial import inner membrane translocase subunit tim-8 [Sordaria brevicollis]|uniref:Mitochondrial import inner membrane translocase subunit n=1 Tax=Sordaria brevicollis TaxID=83679 RepID=A0AAE0PJX2_SORBR|nr:mitochondrial import inner membrane translocase subunit tim-8 [Sordaria brevicollis]